MQVIQIRPISPSSDIITRMIKTSLAIGEHPMPTPVTFSLFLSAAVLLAITPGPAIFYVLTRSLKGGRRAGIASACGTAIGGFVHVFAAAVGLSALLATSALVF